MLDQPVVQTPPEGVACSQHESKAKDTEAEQLRERIWTYAQRGVVMAVVFFAGLFVGYQLWGQATQLQEQVEELTERNQSLVKERDTERSKVTLVERDKKELERQLDELKTKLAASGASARRDRPARGRRCVHGGAAPASASGASGRAAAGGTAERRLRARSPCDRRSPLRRQPTDGAGSSARASALR